MVTKKYTSQSWLGFDVEGKSVDFLTHSEGGSYYVTSDKKEQEALEKHGWFGDKFILAEVSGEEDVPVYHASNPEVFAEAEPAAVEVQEEAENKVAGVESVTHFDTRGEAAAWLKETFGIPTSKLRTLTSCIDAAASNNIKITIG